MRALCGATKKEQVMAEVLVAIPPLGEELSLNMQVPFFMLIHRKESFSVCTEEYTQGYTNYAQYFSYYSRNIFYIIIKTFKKVFLSQ